MDENKKIFAIVGMAGSGKTEVVKYLQKKYRWPKIYLPQALFDEIEKLGLELNWENERKIREGMRKEHGKSVFAKLALPKIKEELQKSPVVLLESLYGWGEYKIIKQAHRELFEVIAVYGSPAIRFGRLQSRKKRPMKDFKDFEQRDQNEIEVTEKGGPIAIADHTIINHGSVDDLHRALDAIMIKEGIMEAPTVSAEE